MNALLPLLFAAPLPLVRAPWTACQDPVVQTPTAPAPEGFTPSSPAEWKASIEDFAGPFERAGHLGGTLLVARGSEVLYEGSFGLADRELAVPNAADTRFCIGTISLQVTRALALRMIERGVVASSDTLDKWFPDFPNASAITVDHLVHGMSGLPQWIVPREERTRPWSTAELVEKAAQAEPEFEPGKRANLGLGGMPVLVRVLELAGGKSFQELLRDEVLAPAGMSRTQHAGSTALVPLRASYYAFTTAGFRNAPLEDVSHVTGGGSIWSTPRDLFLFVRALLAGKLGEAPKGLVDTGLLVRWDGLIGAHRGFVDYFPEDDTCMIFLGNIRSGAVEGLRFAVQALLRGEPVPPLAVPEVEPVAVDVEVLQKYCGSFQTPGRVMDLHLRGDDLYFDDWVLIPLGNGAFFSPQDYARAQVIVDQEGIGRRLDWTIKESTLPCKRVD